MRCGRRSGSEWGLLLVLAVSLCAQTSRKPGSVEGSVVNSITKGPVRKATVVMRDLRQGYSYVAVSDETGAFQFPKVDPDSYVINSVDAQGYFYQQGRESTIAVAEEQRVTGIKLEVLPLGVISGKVLDDDGEPLVGVSVQAMVYDYSRGFRTLVSGLYTSTNDRGEYRIFDIRPGRYYVRAVPRNAQAGLPEGLHRNVPEMGYPTVFYPSASDPTEATAAKVTAGAEASGIDFRLRRVPVYHIRGTAPAGEGNGSAVIVAQCGGTGGFDLMNRLPTMRQANGHFDMGGLTPGLYCLTVQTPQSAYAHETVTVSDRNVEGVTLTPTTVEAIPGTVTMDGAEAQPPSLRVSMQATSGFSRNVMGTTKDGAFTLNSVVPDTYQVFLRGLLPGMYLKSMRYGDQDVSDGLINVRADGSALTLVLGTDAGQLSGTAQTDGGDPAAAMLVTIAPEDRLVHRRDLLTTTVTGPSGSFQVPNLAPGDYRVYVWDDKDVPMAMMADFRKQFANRAATVTVPGSGQATVQVKAIPAAEIQAVKDKFQ